MLRTKWVHLGGVFPALIAGVLLFCGCGEAPQSPQDKGTKPGQAGATPVVAQPVPGEQGKQPAGIRIGFVVKQPEELWFQNEWKFARVAAEKYGFELLTLGASDGERVLNVIDTLGTKGAQGFVICTPETRMGPAIMARAQKYGMKVIAVDDQFVGADGKFMQVPYMGLSAREIGRNVGKALWAEMQRRQWPITETAACVVTHDELNTVKERTDGAAEALVEAGFPAERIFRSNEREMILPSAHEAASIVLTQHNDVKYWLVFSVNDEGVLGAVRALGERGLGADRTIGIGIGAGTGLLELKKETPSGFFGTVMISPYRHGYETTEMLYKWIKDGVAPPLDTRTAGVLATRENYKQVIKDLGLEDVAGDK